MLTDEQLAELERLDREATPGPWSNGAAYGARVVDAHIISAARNALPVLVAEVRRLRDARAVLEGVTDCLTRERDEARAAIRHAADVMSCTPDGNDDFVEAVSLLVQERDEARAEVARLAQQVEVLLEPLISGETRAALDRARREGAEEMRERAAQLFDGSPNVPALANMTPFANEIRALPLPGDE